LELDLAALTFFASFLPVTCVLPLGVTDLISGDAVRLALTFLSFFLLGVSGLLEISYYLLLFTFCLSYPPAANGDFLAALFLS